MLHVNISWPYHVDIKLNVMYWLSRYFDEEKLLNFELHAFSKSKHKENCSYKVTSGKTDSAIMPSRHSFLIYNFVSFFCIKAKFMFFILNYSMTIKLDFDTFKSLPLLFSCFVLKYFLSDVTRVNMLPERVMFTQNLGLQHSIQSRKKK